MLAEGGMATVYLAVAKGQANFEKLVVIKELRESLAQDPTFVQMFMDEARLAARLNHPNVVQTYEVGSDGDRHFIAMEFCEGVPYTRLSRLRDRIPPPLAIHVRILADVLYGLQYAHELREFEGRPLEVVHRDVSPQNVMLMFAGGVKVLDFGIAKAALAVEQRPDDFKGKLEYMAPEQALLEQVDRRADVYAVGIMLWEAIARRRMYERGEDKYARLVSGELPDLFQVRPDAPRKLAHICLRALARRREERYASAVDMAHDLEEWLDGTTQHVRARDVGSYVTEKFSSTREKITEAVEAQLKLLRSLPDEGPESSIPLSRIHVVTEQPPAPDPTEPCLPPYIPPDPPTGSTVAVWSAPQATTPPPPQAKKSGLVALAAIGAVLFVATLATVVALATKKHTPDQLASAAAGASASGENANVEIEFTVKASPPQSKIFVDGQEQQGNPANGKRPRDGAMHVVRVECPGFDPREEQLAFDRSFLVTLELHPATKATPPPTGESRGAPPPVANGNFRRPFVAPPPPPPQPFRGGGGTTTSGAKKGASGLDTENPYP
jgi:serine/threonine-protein kinase